MVWGGSFLVHCCPFLPVNNFFAKAEQETKRDCVILLSEVWFITAFGRGGACLKKLSKVLPVVKSFFSFYFFEMAPLTNNKLQFP